MFQRLLVPKLGASLGSTTLRNASLTSFRTARTYSVKADNASASPLRDIEPSDLKIQRTGSPKKLLDAKDLVFGKNFTDHMLTIEWTSKKGWLAPQITPYQNLSLDPATCVFHYAFECFEGLKAYKSKTGEVRLFRPDKNMARMNQSAARIALPNFGAEPMVELIKKFVALEERFIPEQRGYSLYLRPTMIGTQKTLGVGPPGSALLYVIASPVGPYYPTGFKAVSLSATSNLVRAWPGGVGDKKLGANYAPCIVPQLEAAKQGYQQNLWLFGEEGYVTEVGTMNVFFAWTTPEGKKELVTAPLDGTILNGVTRDSILALAREKLIPEGWQISERKFTMADVAKAADEGRLLEAFGAGTAAVVSPINKIHWDGGIQTDARDIVVPLQEGKEAGPLAEKFWDWMAERQYGDVESDWSVVVPKLEQ